MAITMSSKAVLLVFSLIGTNAFTTNQCSNTRRVSSFGMDLHMTSLKNNEIDAVPALQSRRKAFLQTIGSAAAGVLSFSFASPARSAAAAELKVGGKLQFGDESIMAPKEHGTSAQPVQEDLRYGVSRKLADKICNFNRHFAEMGGYFESTNFEELVSKADGPITFYDSVTGKPLFVAPISRSAESFITESEVHGWPSFRDDEVVWENVRILRNSGETVSIDGTHLGHNLPDKRGNRYCINLVSIAGSPSSV